MHPLTKVLAVLAALMSLALATLTIVYTANAESVRAGYLSERSRREAAEEASNRDRASYNTELLRKQAESDALNNQIAELRGVIADMQRDNARLLADVQTAKAAEASVQAKIDQLSATNQTLSNLISQYRTEVQTLRESELRYAQREIELADRNSDLTGQLEVALENNRALQEQLVELRDQLASARAGGAGAAGEGGAVVASIPVRARVTGVRRDANGALLVQIDAGANDRLREQMELSIVRGNQFLAKVVLQAVDIEESVGRVDFLSRPETAIQTGDLVMSLVQ